MEVPTLHTQTETLLVVDDEPLMTNLFQEYMSRQGYRVLTAHSGQEALDLLENEAEAVALIVMDQTMPELNGLETSRRILERAPTIPILLTSGFNAGQNENLPANIVGTIMKPYQNRALAERIRQILEK